MLAGVDNAHAPGVHVHVHGVASSDGPVRASGHDSAVADGVRLFQAPGREPLSRPLPTPVQQHRSLSHARG